MNSSEANDVDGEFWKYVPRERLEHATRWLFPVTLLREYWFATALSWVWTPVSPCAVAMVASSVFSGTLIPFQPPTINAATYCHLNRGIQTLHQSKMCGMCMPTVNILENKTESSSLRVNCSTNWLSYLASQEHMTTWFCQVTLTSLSLWKSTLTLFPTS